jgi:CNT family concentrative nucleoside transporter
MLLALFAEAAWAANLRPHETTIVERLVSLIGIFVMLALCWALSEHRSKVKWRIVAWGVALQLVLASVVLSPTISGFFFTVVNGGVNQLLEFSGKGAEFVFQTVEPHQITVGFGEGEVQTFAGTISPPIKTFAFWILPTIVFFSALMSVAYHLGIMQVVVGAFAKVMARTMGTSGAETLSAAGNIFVGQTEAPLLIRPFVPGMTRSELMAVMTGGFATVAGGVMGAYVTFLKDIPNIAGHLVIASIISAPASLVIAKLLVPETAVSETAGEVRIDMPRTATNTIEAAANGASDGMKLAINVAAMLMAMVALVSMVDWMIGLLPVRFCGDAVMAGWSSTCADASPSAPMSLSILFSWLFWPIAFLMGVPVQECGIVAGLLGEKIVLTEFIAYIHLGDAINGPVAVISERGAVITSYALCGFANFASIGIQLGGIGGIAPQRMGDIASLGFKAMWAGALAACVTGAVVGLFL